MSDIKSGKTNPRQERSG